MPLEPFNPKGKLTRNLPKYEHAHSSYNLASLDGNNLHFEYSATLGTGTFGTVHLLLDKASGQSIALKKIVPKNTDSEKNIEEEATCELNFYKQIYPKLAFHWEKVKPSKEGEKLSYRIIMPLFPRRNFLEAGSVYRHSFFLLLKNCARELERIHNLGIVHGDIKILNVLVAEDLSVYFIDYDWAYNLSDQHARVAIEQEVRYFPPERKVDDDSKSPAPSTAQDIYSFAYMVYELIKCIRKFSLPPEIFSWLYLALSDEPEHRPSLKQLINLLERRELHPITLSLYREDIITANLHVNPNDFQHELIIKCFAERLPYEEKQLREIIGEQIIYEYFNSYLEERKNLQVSQNIEKELDQLSVSVNTMNTSPSPTPTPNSLLFYFPNATDLKSRLPFNPFKEFK